MMLRRSLLLALAMLPVAARAQAPAPTVAPASPAPAPATPDQPIAALNDALQQAMHAGRATPFAQRLAILRPVVEQAFDLPLILKNSLGPGHWSNIPDPQKTDLLEVFIQFTVASYVANFDSYSGEKFIIAPEQRNVGKDVVVQTRILTVAGDATRLDYVMRDEDAGWRVVDILLDGSISRVAVTRSDFRALLGQDDASKLIDSLRGKVASLTVGAAP
jgi:phospholipid transport system substrate-binding protein